MINMIGNILVIISQTTVVVRQMVDFDIYLNTLAQLVHLRNEILFEL
jgi:hypothetical protein